MCVQCNCKRVALVKLTASNFTIFIDFVEIIISIRLGDIHMYDSVQQNFVFFHPLFTNQLTRTHRNTHTGVSFTHAVLAHVDLK